MNSGLDEYVVVNVNPDSWGILYPSCQGRSGMRDRATEREQPGKASARLRMIQHSEQMTPNVSRTCRFFEISRAQFYIWLRRYR